MDCSADKEHTQAKQALSEWSVDVAKWLALDAFGTLLDITHPVRPFVDLKKTLEQQPGLDLSGFAVEAMAHRHGLVSLAAHYGYHASHEDQQRWSAGLEEELQSIQPFPDAEAVVEQALLAGWNVVVCSNLAAPYAAAVDAFLAPFVERYGRERVVTAYSCDVGYLKPQPAFFWTVEKQLGSTPRDMAMMGDRYVEDVCGPRACGWKAFQVERSAGIGLLDGWTVLSKASHSQ